MDKNQPNHLPVSHKRECSLIEQAWLNIAKQRLDDILSNKVKTIPCEVVFERINQRLG
ncbi:addiction module protein [Methylophilus sp. OH31]|uniref:addiction module protein n=1 Tax=Methylophilus sp. OH31 TaxID=1387312 RepID=UPI0004BC99CC|nr:addiction module protein [Methylophilus sp. OH31]